MIHQVAVKSLPQEWLWCQTWCSDTTFEKAKVIDLCNNPQTKEAKLTAAQRIVPEWKDYDTEIKNLMGRVDDVEQEDHEGHAEDNEEKPEQDAEQPAVVSDENKHSELWFDRLIIFKIFHFFLRFKSMWADGCVNKWICI